jgi:hypothetical protein
LIVGGLASNAACATPLITRTTKASAPPFRKYCETAKPSSLLFQSPPKARSKSEKL